MIAQLAIRLLPSLAFRAWFTPPPLPERTARRDARALEGLERVAVTLSDGRTVTGRAKGEGPLVLALHGWGGRAAQMAPLAERLAGEGMRTVAVDLPGRAGGPPTDIEQAARAIATAVEALGPPELIVAHSFAALALRVVPRGAAPSLVVMAAPVIRVSDALERFSERMRLAPWTSAALPRRLRAWDPALFDLLNGSDPSQLPDSEVLILHDPADGDASFASAAELAALRPRTSLRPVPGAGHNAVLKDPAVLDHIVAFAANGPSVPTASAGGRV